MSATLHVGWLDEMRRLDPQGFSEARTRFATMRHYLSQQGLPDYVEPPVIEDGSWSVRLTPVNGIAHVQRLAAEFQFRSRQDPWPAPADPASQANPLELPIVEDAYSLLDTNIWQHLILHSPRDGYWLPVDFPDVLFPDRDPSLGTFVGSSVRLLDECQRMMSIIDLPLDMNATAVSPFDTPITDGVTWRRYPVEAYNLLLIRDACARSIQSGAAVVVGT